MPTTTRTNKMNPFVSNKMNPFVSNFSRSMKVKQSPEMSDKKRLGRTASHADDDIRLINAVAHEDVDMVSKILKNDVDICALRHPGFSALHHVCINGNTKIFDIFLSYGNLDLNIESKTGFTPLKLAVVHGHFDIASKLISLGAKEDDIKHGVQ